MKEFYKFYSMGFLCLFLFCSLPGSAQVQTARHISTSANSGGFYEYLPAGYNTGSQTYPLIVYLEGIGELGNGTTDLPLMLHNGPPFLINGGRFPETFTAGGRTFSFIVISPQFINFAQPSDIDAVVTYALKNYRVDASRIYIVGISLGGGSVWGYASQIQFFPPHKIAAIIPVAGAASIDAAGGQRIANAGIAVYATHNSGDPTVPVATTVNNIAEILKANPPDPITPIDTIFNVSGHDAWSKTFDPSFTNPRIGSLNAYQWMLTHQAAGVILPVTLTDYRAFLSDQSSAVTVDWTTAKEENNNYFILQRSGDGANFRNLDSIPSAGGGGHSYTDIDHSPLPGNNFYRLSQVDNDGKATEFSILEVSIASAAGSSALRLSPNPARNILFLDLQNPHLGTLEARISDVQGKVIRAWKFTKQQVVWGQSLDISNIPPGNYFITVEGGSIKEVKQFIKTD
jgi:hypothetical protein